VNAWKRTGQVISRASRRRARLEGLLDGVAAGGALALCVGERAAGALDGRGEARKLKYSLECGVNR
jgi:hypothetical protein